MNWLKSLHTRIIFFSGLINTLLIVGLWYFDITDLFNSVEVMVFITIITFLTMSIVVYLNYSIPLHEIVKDLKDIRDHGYENHKTYHHASTSEIDPLSELIFDIVKTHLNVVDEITTEKYVVENNLDIATKEYETEVKTLFDDITKNREKIIQVSEDINIVKDTLSITINHLDSKISQLSDGSQNQSNSIAEVSAAMGEMVTSIIDIARSAELSAKAADESKEAVHGGDEKVNVVQSDVSNIYEGFNEVYKSMKALNDDVECIGDIAQTIEDIADQTNLLALNAAIEAARAGDAGRGFAVVADEVRKLAEKSILATKDVFSAVRTIKENSSRTLGYMDKSGEIIKDSVNKTQDAKDSLEVILKKVAESYDQVRSIATASEEQSSVTEEINKIVESVSEISLETTANMEECKVIINKLSKQLEVLNDLSQKLNDI